MSSVLSDEDFDEKIDPKKARRGTRRKAEMDASRVADKGEHRDCGKRIYPASQASGMKITERKI
ncbi:hypothetical protein WOLCODRAFT_150480 [Wolfiporia cocos MD-104 SS10]|uniref:Uncharacterized protein n=1 Tax=Wolfiporia cocos (strain MD-104) TaxID=742152 RepID=A0A2H3JFW8_WOLCO|nr:hypothetical protein WOLCODRAFT_150480 [Wolfiporia cocos MD-104 SS10]